MAERDARLAEIMRLQFEASRLSYQYDRGVEVRGCGASVLPMHSYYFSFALCAPLRLAQGSFLCFVSAQHIFSDICSYPPLLHLCICSFPPVIGNPTPLFVSTTICGPC